MNEEFDFCAEWTNHLLKGLEENGKIECAYENCAEFHYKMNQMDSVLDTYVGDLDGFISFLKNTYWWLITCSDDGKTILIDENKDFCVCPVAGKIGENVSPMLCNCSAFYAKKMFSKVCQREVNAAVKRSFLRDGKSCMYEIHL